MSSRDTDAEDKETGKMRGYKKVEEGSSTEIVMKG